MGLRPVRRARPDAEGVVRPTVSETATVRAAPSAAREPMPTDGSRRPSAVSEALWAAVPESIRADVLAAVARDVVRCVHPEASVERQLAERGLPTRVEVKHSPIVVALHRAFGGKGAPGAASAAAEARVLEAIRNDPVGAWSEPGRLSLVTRVPENVLVGMVDLIRWEAERAMTVLRERKAAGDPSADWWVDPEAWAIEHEEGYARSVGPSR